MTESEQIWGMGDEEVYRGGEGGDCNISLDLSRSCGTIMEFCAIF